MEKEKLPREWTYPLAYPVVVKMWHCASCTTCVVELNEQSPFLVTYALIYDICISFDNFLTHWISQDRWTTIVDNLQFLVDFVIDFFTPHFDHI